METTTPSCINCGADVTAAHCGNCGQKNPGKKLNFTTLWVDFQSRIYGFDGMFPRTLRDLTVRPGEVAKSFIAGNRVKYVGPVGYFFLITTIAVLLFELLNVDFYEFMLANNPVTVQTDAKGAELVRNTVAFIFNNLKIFRFILIPFCALWTWIIFRKHKLTMLESSIPVFYAMGHVEFTLLINVLLFYFFHWHFNSYTIFIQLMYYGFVCYGLFGKTAGSFIKGMVAWVVAFISYQLFLLAAVGQYYTVFAK